MTQQLPEDRYGSRARQSPRRGLRWALLGLVIVVTAIVAAIGYKNLGSPPIEGKQVAFDVTSDSTVRLTIEVHRDDPHRSAECVVRARSISGEEVGRKEVLIPPASVDTVRNETVIRTSARSVTGDVYGCSYNVPEYLSSTTRPTG